MFTNQLRQLGTGSRKEDAVTPEQNLANWILHSRPTPVTHLKLQKLAFYCVGATMAYGLDAHLGGRVAFEAWEHGPVCRTIWKAFRDCGAQAISPSPTPPVYEQRLASLLDDVVEVYGAMTAWQLRQQSHLEAPWRNTPQGQEIDDEAIRQHFRWKLSGAVHLPEMLAQQWTFAIDGIPSIAFRNLHELAASLRSTADGV